MSDDKQPKPWQQPHGESHERHHQNTISRNARHPGPALTAWAAEPPVARAAEIKIGHDWPGYTGPEGTFADPSRGRLLDDLSQAKLVWVSEQERWARARLLNIATHEVHLTGFTPGEKALTLKGTVLFHSDRYVNPSSQRPGVVAMDVELALDRDGEGWKGTYKGVYGSPWTGSGKIVGPK